MEERRQSHNEEVEIDFGKYFTIFRRKWWKITLFSIATGIISLFVTFQMSNIYKATAVITPAVEEGKKSATLGALAIFGIDIGGPSTVGELDTLFNSSDLTVRVFRKYDLWPIIMGDRYDPSTGMKKPSWIGILLKNEKDQKKPTDWDAIRQAEKRLTVSINKRAGTLSISFESPSAEGSANIVKYFLEEGKNRLQEEALERAGRNKRFIEEQISRTHDALTKDRLYSMYSQEVEKEMMARNREQFGFRVIDSPRVPDKKFKPHRAQVAILTTVLSFFTACILFMVRG